MAQRFQSESAKNAHAGTILLVIHEFIARSPDELSLAKGDRIELIERDDDFGDGWYLGRHLQNGNTGLFPEVYTTVAPKGTLATNQTNRLSAHRVAAQSATTSQRPTNATLNHSPASSPQPSPGAVSLRTTAQTQPIASSASVPSSSKSSPMASNFSHQAARNSSSSSTVMNETLSVIDEHITDMRKPGRSKSPRDRRLTSDSASDYGAIIADMRQSYIQGYETEEEEMSRQLSEKEVKAWSPTRVAKYLESVGVETRHCEVFLEQEFSGEVILGMDQSSIFLKELDLGPIGRRLRTWQKIRALQDEVSPPKPSQTRKVSESSQPSSRRESSSSMGMLPRSSLQAEKLPSETVDGLAAQAQASGPAGSALAAISGAARQSPRPSAASVRSLGHSRRQSSIDQALSTSTSSTPQISGVSHNKQSSFDRNWNMSSATSQNNSRPVSSHMHSASSDRIAEKRDSPHLTLSTAVDNDRGYVSGSEADGTRPRRVLKKLESLDHHRASSYEAGKRNTFFRRHSKASSPSHSREISAPLSVAHLESGADLAAAKQTPASRGVESSFSPTVTNLESSNRNGSAKGSDLSGSVPQPAASPRKGLRAISDAVTGKEKSLFFDNGSPSVEASTPQTPSSETPSAPHSMDLGDANQSKFATPLGIRSMSTTMRKSKKKTSAYIRGLERKPPQEQIVGCDYSGWMKKRSSNLMTNWKPRLFVLRGRRLSYYYSENDTEEKGLIDISGHRVLPADNERLTGLHASITKATSSPTSPQMFKSPTITSAPTTASPTVISADDKSDANPPSPSAASALSVPTTPKNDGGFIFKLVPPRAGMSKAVNFTKPTVHYFAVPSIEVGRLWMAALMKATIDRDESVEVITTYQQKTISLAKARARKERPPALRGLDEEEINQAAGGSNEVDSVLEKVDEATDTEGAEEADMSAKPSSEELPVQMREVTDLEPLVSKNAMSPGNHSKKGSRASNSKRTSSADGLGIQGLSNGASW